MGLKGFTGFLPTSNLTFCSDFGSSAQSRGSLKSDLVAESRHLAFYNAGMPNIRGIVTSFIGRAQRSIGRASAMGVGTYLFGEGYPSPMFQNGH